MDRFKRVAAHMLKGLMYHRDFEDYLRFLGFEDLADMQRDRYLEESNSFACIHTEYMNLTGKLLKYDTPIYQSPIPENWYNYYMDDVDNNTRQRYVRAMFEIWKNWEKETLALYNEIGSSFHQNGCENCSLIMQDYIKDVYNELQLIESMWINFEMCDWKLYDIIKLSKDFNWSI